MSKGLIIGAGIAGLTLALALPPHITATIYELRPAPSTIGGSINLTPNAIRLLKSLGVELEGVGCVVDGIQIFSLHTGKSLGELRFGDAGPSLRIMREELAGRLVRAVRRKGVEVVYGRKVVGLLEEEGHVIVKFEDGKEERGDFVVGCDGAHSAVRTTYVQPERVPVYTNVAVAYTLVEGLSVQDTHFRQTAMNSGRCGQILTSFVDPERKKVYLGAVMSTKKEEDKQGWRVRGADREKTMREIERRYIDSAIPGLNELVRKSGEEDWVFYPVYSLGPGGNWMRGRVILLGDAAHAMPPQGESTGLAIEDAILLSRVLCLPKITVEEAFRRYEKTRRPRIETAYKEAVFRWESVKDKSWLLQKVIECGTWLYLWWKADAHKKTLAYDVREEVIVE